MLHYCSLSTRYYKNGMEKTKKDGYAGWLAGSQHASLCRKLTNNDDDITFLWDGGGDGGGGWLYNALIFRHVEMKGENDESHCFFTD